MHRLLSDIPDGKRSTQGVSCPTMTDMTRRSIVITGSTRGIGRGLAAEFLRRGHDVAVSGRTQAAVDEAVAALAPLAVAGARVAGARCDVADAAAVQRLWDAAVAAFGRVDAWINNAGLSHPRQRIGELRAADIDVVAETNLLGMMLSTQVALAGMRLQPGGGTIWNMEGFGSNGMMAPGMSLYGASKFALTYFTKALLAETRGEPVKVCWLSPGIVVTDLVKLDLGSIRDAEAVRTRRIYDILADRVETVTPWLVERMLEPHKAGDRVVWLTRRKALGRFLRSLLRRRQLISDNDLAAG
jgi:NAD(P)-dependent dehydrogenase (short-subunit alcohol dehydrogenase family)